MTQRVTAIRLSLVVVFLAALVLAPHTARIASACSCMENPTCAAVGMADAVVVGAVLERKRETVGGSLGWTVHTVAVSRTLRGSADPIVTLVPDVLVTADALERSKAYPGEQTLGSSCDYPFEIGEQYVIYLRRTPSGRWTTSPCAGTKPLAKAAEDLDYIADLVTAPRDARVYGSVTRMVRDPSDPTRTGTKPAPGVRIALTGAAGFTVTSDAKGEFDLKVPPGEYSVAPAVSSMVKVYGGPRRIALREYSCAPVRFSLIANGRVEGRVVHPDGTAVMDASVDLVPAGEPFDPKSSLDLVPSRNVDKEGRFAIDGIMPGRYLLAINARFGPRAISPYKPTYLVSRDGEPRVFELGEGERLTGFTVVVTPLTRTTLAGHVAFADGRPAPDANVSAVPVDFRGSSVGFTKTNNTGDFELQVFAGLSYVLRAGATTPAGYRQTETAIAVDGPQEGLQLRIQP